VCERVRNAARRVSEWARQVLHGAAGLVILGEVALIESGIGVLLWTLRT